MAFNSNLLAEVSAAAEPESRKDVKANDADCADDDTTALAPTSVIPTASDAVR